MDEVAQSASHSSEPAVRARWRIRAAGRGDVDAVAHAVRELLVELGATPPRSLEMQDAAFALIDDHEAGVVFLAEAEDRLVGVLAASWQLAIHIPGAYALIQDLWVQEAWRGQEIGAGLLDALFALARSRHMRRVEVGLPQEHFAQFAATEAFYLSNGFTPNGPRMKRPLG